MGPLIELYSADVSNQDNRAFTSFLWVSSSRTRATQISGFSQLLLMKAKREFPRGPIVARLKPRKWMRSRCNVYWPCPWIVKHYSTLPCSQFIHIEWKYQDMFTYSFPILLPPPNNPYQHFKPEGLSLGLLSTEHLNNLMFITLLTVINTVNIRSFHDWDLWTKSIKWDLISKSMNTTGSFIVMQCLHRPQFLLFGHFCFYTTYILEVMRLLGCCSQIRPKVI